MSLFPSSPSPGSSSRLLSEGLWAALPLIPGMEAEAAIPAPIAAWWTRGIPATIIAGMASYWLFRWLVG